MKIKQMQQLSKQSTESSNKNFLFFFTYPQSMNMNEEGMEWNELKGNQIETSKKTKDKKTFKQTKHPTHNNDNDNITNFKKENNK